MIAAVQIRNNFQQFSVLKVKIFLLKFNKVLHNQYNTPREYLWQ